MIKKLFTLFKIVRKLSKSDTLKIAFQFHKPPIIVKTFFKILSFSFSNKESINLNIDEKKDFLIHYKLWELPLLS